VEGEKLETFYSRTLENISAIHAGRDGGLWVGGNGLRHLKDGIETVYTPKDGLAADNVKVIIEDAAGGLWFGGYGGLTHFRDGRLKRWTEQEGLPNPSIRSLYQDKIKATGRGFSPGGKIFGKEFLMENGREFLIDCQRVGVLVSVMSARGNMPALRTTKKWLSGMLVGALLSLSVGLGCGSAADLDPKECCKSMCQHADDSKDAKKCCQQNKQTKASIGVPLADITLARKLFDSALFIDTHPLDRLFDGMLVERTSAPSAKILKFPQPEIYKLTSAFLI